MIPLLPSIKISQAYPPKPNKIIHNKIHKKEKKDSPNQIHHRINHKRRQIHRRPRSLGQSHPLLIRPQHLHTTHQIRIPQPLHLLLLLIKHKPHRKPLHPTTLGILVRDAQEPLERDAVIRRILA